MTKSVERKKTVNQESYIQQSYPLKLKEKLRHSQKNKNRKFIASRTALQEIIKTELQAEMKGP